MPASLAMSRVRVAAKPFWVNSFLAACMIFSSVEISARRSLGVGRVREEVLPGDVVLPDFRDAFATGPVFVSGAKILPFLI